MEIATNPWRLGRALLLAAAIILAASLAVGSGEAKGDSHIVGATLSGGDLVQTLVIQIDLPESYDPMEEMEIPPPASPRPPEPGEMPFGLVMHYDFAEFGGPRDWHGRFDGVETLYFVDTMQVGPGTWPAGWYRANPALAEQLRAGLGEGIMPPATGAGGLLR